MLIVEFRTDLLLGKVALERAPEMVVYDEEQYLTDGRSQHIFWAEGGDFEAFEEGMEADPTVRDHRRLSEVGPRRLYRVTATELGDEHTTLSAIKELDIVLLDAEGSREGWTVRMRVPDRETFDRYRCAHRSRDLPFRLKAIYHEADADSVGEADLTEPQREALTTAYEVGYYDVPRRTSQAAVAEALDISSQSLSERLRRGTAALVEASLS